MKNVKNNMVMEEMSASVKKLLANFKIEQAIKEVIKWAIANKNTELQNDMITLQARFSRVKRQEHLGLISYTEALREQSFLVSSILDIIQRLEEANKIKADSTAQDINEIKIIILFLASMPVDEAKLQLEKEYVRISTNLQNNENNYKLKAEFAVTPTGMQEAILMHKPNIVHYSGHGESNGDNEGGIILQDHRAESQLVPGRALSGMFKLFQKKFNINVVILNSCYSEDQAVEIAKHVKYVIGMTDAIEDDAAIEFASGFYKSMANEYDVRFSFEFAINLLQIQGIPDEDIPILYEDGAIVEINP